MKRISYFSLIVFLIFFYFPRISFAQDITGTVANPVIIKDESVEDGSIYCSDRNRFKLCDLEYDNSIAGVVSKSPAAYINSDAPDSYLSITSGEVKVRVKGSIGYGELVTTSTTAGVGVRATRNGYVLGNALESFSAENADSIGTVLVSINIHPTTVFADTRSNLFEILRQAVSSPVVTPLSALRYILAALVTIVSFILGFLYFGRLAKTALEGVSRNPLAVRTIQLTLIVHIVFTLLIFLGGLGIAYMILAL